MTSRQRGASWLLALILAGRLLDALDLPFERQAETVTHLHARAASDSLNLEATGDIRTPALDSAATATRREPASVAQPIDVNLANTRELQTLPRVGPVLAARIVAWREANGPFRSASDLKRVPGIGARTAAQLAPLVRFEERR